MTRRKEPSEAELREAQLKAVAEARETGKTELDLRSELFDVVREACTLKSLTKLTLRTGKLTQLPDELGQLENLESLFIDNNQLESLPASIGRLAKLHTLYAYHNKIAELPESFGDLASLRKLVLWQNLLERLPPSFGRLTQLVEVELKWNRLAELPDEIAGLESLEDLDLNDNRLSSLPADLSRLKKLRRLSLNSNQLRRFPKGILTLPALVELDLSENPLATLPSEIGQLKRLRELNLEKCPVAELPDALFDLPLSSLNLQQCELAHVPPRLADLKHLIELHLWGNPIPETEVPDAVLRKSKGDVLRHLGLEKPRVVEGDLPPEPERAAIVERYQPRFEKFVREAKRRLGEDDLDRTVAFLSGKSNLVPPVPIARDDEYAKATELLAPYPEWTFIERRVLALFAQEAWRFKQPGHDYETGIDDHFYGWLKPYLEAEPEGSMLFSDLAGELIGCGVEEDVLLRGALDELDELVVRKDGSPTSLGRYVLCRAAAKTALLVELGRWRSGIKQALVALLIRHDRETFVKVGAELLTLEPDDDGDLHTPYEALGHACAIDPARYEALVLESIVRTNCDPCRAETGRVLHDHYPQHRAQALELARRTLRLISERKNKEERYHFYWSGGARWSDGTARYVGWVLASFGPEVHGDVRTFVEKTKVFDLEVAEVVARALGQAAIDMLGEGLKMEFDDDDIADHFRRMFGLLAPLDWSAYHHKGWELARSEHKKVRQTACLALSRLDPAIVVPQAKAMTASKLAHEREGGVLILSLVGGNQARAELERLLGCEKNDDARDIIVDTFFDDREACDAREAAARVRSAKERGKLDRPAARWLDEKKLPRLTWTDGKPVDAESLRFLFYRQTRRREIEIDPEVRGVLLRVDRRKSGPFAEKLFALVEKNGGVAAKNRFALALVGALGDPSVIAPLQELAIEGRNENAVATLGLFGSFEAARALDRVIKAFRVKYPNVREAAQVAFGGIAERMKLSPFELADSMIPDFGMKDGRVAIAGVKPKLYAAISGDRKLVLEDEDGAVVKPPKTLAAKPKAELKALGDEVAEAARSLRTSLEYYLIVRRRWSAADFRRFFLGNPLAFAFARGLVWGAQGAFFVEPSGDLVDGDGKSVVLGDVQVSLVHPLELDAKERERLKRVLAARSMRPPFAQIDRPIFFTTDEERAQTRCFRFEDREVPGLTFKGRAERLGWRRGSVVDSGAVSAYRKVFPHDRIEAFVRTEGLGVQSYDDDNEATLKEVFFVRAGAVVTGSYTYDEPKDDRDERLVRLSDVPPIVFSETVSDLTAITRQKEGED